MNSTATATPTSTAAFRLSEADIGVLSRVNRFHYLTAHQLTRLAFPAYRDADRYSRRRLHRLAEAGLLLRLRALPMPRFGSAPQVFTLARPGYALLSGLGIPTPAYFRPAEEHKKAENFPFMQHTLAVVDTLITIERACQTLGFTIPQLLTERELKREPVRVRVPPASPEAGTARVVPVIPDAWVQIAAGTCEPYCVALELDRATEWQQRWRGKVAALAEWARGPYKAAFGVENLTIAVVVPTEERADALVTWTQAELDSRGLGDLLELFLFSAAAPNTTDPAHWVCGGHWNSGTGEPASLLPAPQPVEQVVLLSPR